MKKDKLRASLRIKFLILIVTTILIVLMFPRGESLESEVSIGSIWIQDDLIAGMSFPINKNPEAYRKELDAAKRNVFQIFQKRDDLITKSLDSLRKYNKFIIAMIDSNLAVNQSDLENPTFLPSNYYKSLKSLRNKDRSSNKQNLSGLNHFFISVEKSIVDIYNIGILSLPYSQIARTSIAIRQGNIDRIDRKAKYITVDNYTETLRALIAGYYPSGELEDAAFKYAAHFVTANLVYSSELTSEEIEIAQKRVSRYSGIVNENERVVAKHDRITPEIKNKIDSFRIAKAERIGQGGLFLQSIGKFLHVFSLLFLFSIYLFLFRKKIYADNLKLLLIAILFLWVTFVTFLTNQLIINDAVKLLIFVPTASMLFTIIFDSRVGFYSTVIMALLAGALKGNDYTFVIMSIVAGALSAYSVRDIKNRTQIFRSFIFIFIGYTTTILAFGFERFESWQKIMIEFAFAGTSSLLSPVLTYGLLIFFERIFKITTELTLLELSNFDRPLLRDLARKAPGSFNHSITIGTLAEAASEAVGANPLLARVGAYYHDIGKTLTPQYFVENQLDNKNIHEQLSPEESVKVIIDHVRRGIELAKENELPPEIIDFIPMHHGTTIVNYFYEKAKSQSADEIVNIKDFRYPGPAPQTKETAIVMLADTCESAVRTIETPDSDKVEALITNLINSRIADGQLDESPITFSDIARIKDAFVNILLGQHHRRIRYPNQDEMEKKE